MSADPLPKSRDMTSSLEYEPMDEDIPAPRHSPVHKFKKYARQPVSVDRPQGCPDESTLDHEYEPMDEGIPPPQQRPVRKKYDRQPVAVDRPQGCPDESTVEYEPMDEDILQNRPPQINIRQGGVLQRAAPDGNVNPQKSPQNGSVGKDPPQNSPATTVSSLARGTVNTDPHENTTDLEGSHIYETLDRELPPSPTEYTGVYVIDRIDEAPPDYDKIVSQQIQPRHQYQALNVGQLSNGPVLPVATTTSVAEQPKQSCCTLATTALVMAIVMLILFGPYLIFLPLVIPALILAIVAYKSETSKSCFHIMVGISITLSIITLCIALIVFYPAILFGVPIGIFVCVCQR